MVQVREDHLERIAETLRCKYEEDYNFSHAEVVIEEDPTSPFAGVLAYIWDYDRRDEYPLKVDGSHIWYCQAYEDFSDRL